MDKFQRIAYDVLEDLKQRHPVCFAPEFEFEPEDFDEILLVAILNGIEAGMDIAQSVMEGARSIDCEGIAQRVVEKLSTSGLLHNLGRRQSKDDDHHDCPEPG